MIVGVGVDVVDLGRFAAALARTPRLRERLFTAGEAGLPEHSLAARFAAKEALTKALRRPAGLRWHDAEVRRAADGAPELHVAGYEHLRFHVSLSHDAGVATAVVVVEDPTGTAP